MTKPTLSIVVPWFNEADNIPLLDVELRPVVHVLRRERPVEIVFVDDGSTDGTGDLVERVFSGEPDVRVVRHERNRGLGAALRTGFGTSTGEVIVTADSDGTYPFSLIPTLLELLSPGVDLVTASCYHPLGGVENVPAYRLFLSRTASLMYRALLDWRIHTYTCMFRAYRRRVLESVSFHSDGFLAVTELLVNALIAGFVVCELPCTLRVRRYGVSKAKTARIISSHLGFQWRLIRSLGLRRLPRSSPQERLSEGEGIPLSHLPYR